MQMIVKKWIERKGLDLQNHASIPKSAPAGDNSMSGTVLDRLSGLRFDNHWLCKLHRARNGFSNARIPV
jgi:hypothetical protein